MKIWLIRHGETKGNSERRYIGSTDEGLSEKGTEQARAFAAPAVEKLLVSPMKRCRETANIIFPNIPYTLCEGLRECNFGLFEGKTADELADIPAYRTWVAGGCKGDIPGGESVVAFKARCCESFLSAVMNAPECNSLGLVIHGGCIMAILERYEGGRSFYDYHIGNCEAVLCELKKEGRLRITGGALC